MRKQLRIGNLVEIENHTKVCEVIEIKEKSLRVSYIRSDNGMVHNPIIEIDRIKPISITEEWLLKFGFELNSDEGDCKFYEKGKYGIRWVDGDEFYFYLIMNDRDEYWILKEIYDVHQLQNLYFSLTGEELTFTKDK